MSVINNLFWPCGVVWTGDRGYIGSGWGNPWFRIWKYLSMIGYRQGGYKGGAEQFAGGRGVQAVCFTLHTSWHCQ